MKEKNDKMQYPLKEKIGDPDLFVGRAREFDNFGKWLANIPKCLSKSRVILARRKSGKTAFIQRVFNQLWNQNGLVIPFYLDIAENKIWYPTFAFNYFRTFATQYISFMERDVSLASKALPLKKIREYGVQNSHELLVEDIDSMLDDEAKKYYDSIWQTAYTAPHRYAAILDIRFLVMLDEFQNLASYIYPDRLYQTSPNESMPGSFHSVVESKLAPMLVTGSYVGWLTEIQSKYLQAGRLAHWRMTPYLPPEEGLRAIYKYAEVYQEPITNETAILINELCMSDPFFISCVMQSTYQNRDLTTPTGVVDAVNYEITDRESHMSITWAEYIQLTLKRVNDIHAKNILLHLSKHSERYWTPQELKETLSIDLDLNKIQERLLTLAESDVIERGTSDIQFRGLQDGTLNLILRNRFEQEITGHQPSLKQNFEKQI